MPPVYVFEDSQVDRLYPLTYTRAACELRVGACTLLERLARNLGLPIAGVLVRSPLAEIVRRRVTLAPVNPPAATKDGLLLINGRWLMLKAQTGGLWEAPEPDAAGLVQGTIVWMHLSAALAAKIDLSKLHEARTLEAVLPEVRHLTEDATLIGRPWDLLAHQRAAIEEDFAALGTDNEAMPGADILAGRHVHVSHTTLGVGTWERWHVLEEKNVYLAAGVKVWPGAVLDASGGPIIVGMGTEIRAHAVITGPVAIGAHCVIRNLADIREETTLGPGCRVGGEVNGCIFLANANKQHHGFLGQTIVGEWVNLGAGTTTSNVKNTYGKVNMPLNGREEPTGRQFMGSVIGDHAKLGIGTYLSTGSVVGFGSHIVVPRPPRFVPSFAWLTDKGIARANFEKLEEIAALVMGRRHAEFTPADHALFVHIASEWSLAEHFSWPTP